VDDVAHWSVVTEVGLVLGLSRQTDLNLNYRSQVYGAAGMAVALLIAGIADKYAAQTMGMQQRRYGAVTAAFTFIYTAIFGATWCV
jgi:hypothetical protein